MQNVSVLDQPRWAALDSIATSAHMTFRMVCRKQPESL
jgi:hypothetical protein